MNEARSNPHKQRLAKAIKAALPTLKAVYKGAKPLHKSDVVALMEAQGFTEAEVSTKLDYMMYNHTIDYFDEIGYTYTPY